VQYAINDFLLRLVFVILIAEIVGCKQMDARFRAIGSSYFVLADKHDKMHGGLVIEETGSFLGLMDPAGRIRIGLFAQDEGAGLVILDESGRHRVIMKSGDASERTFIAILDDNGEITSSLGLEGHESTDPQSKEMIERDAKRLLERLKAGPLEGIREADKQISK
jgi:hypothetical protein